MVTKLKGFLVLVLISIFSVGCSLQGTAQETITDHEQIVIINDDVQLESALADSTLDVTRQQNIEVEEELNYDWFRGSKFYYYDKGLFKTLATTTKQEKSITDQEIIALSKDGNRALSYKGEDIYVHNLINGEKKFLKKKTPENAYFADSEGDSVIDVIFDFDNSILEVNLIHVESNETVTWDASKSFTLEGFSANSIKKAPDGIYVDGNSLKEGPGIFKINKDGEVTPVLSLPNSPDHISNYDFLQNDRMIFDGIYEGKSGVFILDQKTNHVELLVAGGKSSEGIWTPSYNISPDEQKIMFDTPVQIGDEFKTNVYMAELQNDKLTNTTRIMENADLYAVISKSGYWSEDSNIAFIATVDKENEGRTPIAVFNIK
ncbi:hypothetical protein ACSVDA_03270 [Cytobacillus sp. Hm23]